MEEIIYPFQNVDGVNVEVIKLINNVIPHSTVYVITYPCWD